MLTHYASLQVSYTFSLVNFKCARLRILSLLKRIYSLDQIWKLLDRPKAELWLEAFQHFYRGFSTALSFQERWSQFSEITSTSSSMNPFGFSASALNSLELKRSTQPKRASDTTPQVDVLPLIRKQRLCTWIILPFIHSNIFSDMVSYFRNFLRGQYGKLIFALIFPFVHPLQLGSSGHHQFLRANEGICTSPLSPIGW